MDLHGNWPDLIGFLGALLVITAYFMRTMMPLRYVAVSANCVLIAYGAIQSIHPVLLLHLVLLPLNLYRLVELRRLIARVREAARSDFSFEWILPFTRPRSCKAGDLLFAKDDRAREMYYLVRGSVRLPELGMVVEPGRMIGEIGLFSPSQTRVTSAVCETEVELGVIDDQHVMNLFHQNRDFSFYMTRLITGRLIEDLRALELASPPQPRAD